MGWLSVVDGRHSVANELKSNWTMTAHLTCIHLRTFCQYAYTAFDVYYLFIYLFVIYLFSNLLPLLAATRIQCRQYVTQLYKKTLQHKNTRLNTVDINVQFTGSVNMWLKCIQNAFFIIIVFSCVILWKNPIPYKSAIATVEYVVFLLQ